MLNVLNVAAHKTRNATDHNCVGITHLQMLRTREHAARTRGPASGCAAGGRGRGYIGHLCWNVEYTVIVFIISDTVFTCDTADNGDDTTKLYIHAWWRAEAGSCEAARGGFWWMMDGEEEETSASCSIADLGTLHLPR